MSMFSRDRVIWNPREIFPDSTEALCLEYSIRMKKKDQSSHARLGEMLWLNHHFIRLFPRVLLIQSDNKEFCLIAL